tara:strand:+ start:2704 stop:3456 length:753 start_codon:yes stop_codon:yes gene_type:complete
MSKEMKSEFKNLIVEKLNFEDRKERLSNDIDKGDVHFFFMSLFGRKAALSAKLSTSIMTSWGMSIYEQACEKLSLKAGFECETQEKVLGELNQDVKNFISDLENKESYIPDRKKEIETIRKLSTPGKPLEHRSSVVDVYIKKPSGEEILIDITTVKNNIKSFQTLKTKTLVWAGLRFSQDIDANVNPYFAIPYNPEGKKIDDINYSRFASNYDREDILVGDELWRKVSDNKFTINDLAEVFQEISSIYKI